jgi:enoyl-CoA hydratase/carnithine racemase
MNDEFEGETLRYRVETHVLTATLNRPERLNALNQTMAREILQLFDRSDSDDDIRAVILTGAGRAFCGGFDLERADIFDSGNAPSDGSALPHDHPIRDLGGRLTLRIFDSLKPVIAAINGPAVGVGATLLLPMDYRIASNDARIGFVFTRRGIVPEAASSWFLPRIVGISRAIDWTLSGRLVPACEAHAAGLIRSLHDSGELLGAARAIADEIVEKVSPVSAALTRQMMWRGLTLDHPMEAHRIDSRLMAARGAHQDSREGVAAFLEKRPAHFSGRAPSDLPDCFPWWSDRRFS